MLVSVQSFVQQRYHALLMSVIGLGFVLLLLELIGYQHYEQLQLIGLGSTIIGAVVSFLGITATGNRRRFLAAVLIVLSVAGLLGTWLHNGERLEGERRGLPAEQFQGRPSQSGENGESQPWQVRPEEGGRPKIPPPPLAPLSLSGFCILGAVALLGRRDPQ
jgi:hypothetical protein